MFRAAIVGLLLLARYDGPTDPALSAWFENQTSHAGKTPCCSVADGHVLTEDQWRLAAKLGEAVPPHYEVFIEGGWHDVPTDAIVDPGKGANPLGKPIVWYGYINGEPRIDCFCPGTMG